MNREKIKQAEEQFLAQYPAGFDSPEMVAMKKKHKLDKMHQMAKELFQLENFEDREGILSGMVKLIGQSSLVSVFEKPKFKDAVYAMDENEKEMLAIGLKEMLYGEKATGFAIMVRILKLYQIAKWPVITAFLYYFHPEEEILIKPTTVKGVIDYYELEGVKYSSEPNIVFYEAYREQIKNIKSEVSGKIKTENAGFCGFLMMGLKKTTEEM